MFNDPIYKPTMFAQNPQKKSGQVGILLLILVLCIIFIPHIAIWAVNVLADKGGSEFQLGHSLKEWWAMTLLMLIFAGSGSASRSS